MRSPSSWTPAPNRAAAMKLNSWPQRKSSKGHTDPAVGGWLSTFFFLLEKISVLWKCLSDWPFLFPLISPIQSPIVLLPTEQRYQYKPFTQLCGFFSSLVSIPIQFLVYWQYLNILFHSSTSDRFSSQQQSDGGARFRQAFAPGKHLRDLTGNSQRHLFSFLGTRNLLFSPTGSCHLWGVSRGAWEVGKGSCLIVVMCISM